MLCRASRVEMYLHYDPNRDGSKLECYWYMNLDPDQN